MSTIALATGKPNPGAATRTAAPVRPHRWNRVRMTGALIALWVLSGVYLVAPDQQAVETMFGRVVAPRVMPGIHTRVPWPMGRVARLKVRQLQRLSGGRRSAR